MLRGDTGKELHVKMDMRNALLFGMLIGALVMIAEWLAGVRL